MNEIAISKKNYEELLAVTKWYEAAPKSNSFYPGDEFHENVFEYQQAALGVSGIDDEEFYISQFEVRDGELFAFVSKQDGTGEDVPTKIIPKNR